jgi:omega-amidase
MRVYCIQADLEWENKETNFLKVSSLLKGKKIQPESLIILPETFSTGFSMRLEVTADKEPRHTETFLAEIAKQKKCWVTGGFIQPSKRGDRGVNRSVTFSPLGERIGSYAKIHPASIYEEEKFHNPGNKVEVFSLGQFLACPLICYDLRFPELFRIGMQKSANLFIVIACWPKIRIGHWVSLLQARAIENQSYVVGVNRVGSDPNMEFGGNSLIIDPKGEILANAGESEMVLSSEIDATHVFQWRDEFPVLKHARTQFLPLEHNS